MTPTLNGQSSQHSGDINLVAALMSQGISLDRYDPLSLIERDGERYASYRFNAISDDGTLETATLTDHWSGIRPLPADHGFAQVSQFIRARPRGAQSTADVLDFAVSYLADRGQTLPGLRGPADIPAFVAALPQAAASYILAYIWNRQILFDLHTHAKRKVYMTAGDGRETRRALIDSKLPTWQRHELLSRLQG